MARLDVKPTRMELNNLKDRLKIASRGHKLLKDKRDELMRQFIELIRQNNQLRQKVEGNLVEGMQELFAVPSKEVALEIRQDSIMSVAVPKLFADVKEAANASEVPYSYVGSNSEMDQAIGSITASLDDLLKLAEIEKTCQLMADEIEKTRRRVNGLEYQIIPQLEETIYYIEMKLEEAERANLIRMMKVKNM